MSIGMIIHPEGLNVEATDVTREEYCFHVQGRVSRRLLKRAKAVKSPYKEDLRRSPIAD